MEGSIYLDTVRKYFSVSPLVYGRLLQRLWPLLRQSDVDATDGLSAIRRHDNQKIEPVDGSACCKIISSR